MEKETPNYCIIKRNESVNENGYYWTDFCIEYGDLVLTWISSSFLKFEKNEKGYLITKEDFEKENLQYSVPGNFIFGETSFYVGENENYMTFKIEDQSYEITYADIILWKKDSENIEMSGIPIEHAQQIFPLFEPNYLKFICSIQRENLIPKNWKEIFEKKSYIL